jgi:maltose O-acetyltransferase
MLRYLVNMIVAVLPPTRAFGFKRFLWLRIGAVVGDGAQINAGARIWGGGPVTVGRDTWLGMNLCIIVPAGSEVTIGSNVDIGPDVMIECGSHDVGGPERRAGTGRAEGIEIGSGSWIGCRATLLGGARIGASSIVAAGALVLPGDYPENVLLKGVPARAEPINPEERDPQ